MKELKQHECMDSRTVKAWETTSGGYVHIYDVRDILHGNYSVERKVCGGMDSIYDSPDLDKCIAYAERYAANH